ncbi:hypothetical protein McanMca71_000864 [Microsporum canis]|uniref:Uncharacterized protein n=1 Tax=Arthroderma otae (strain ATCC MYA-4605 / CBS 113480) TaxID=554155 RepID=C5FIA7_ARTOC|nr:conserved hypothetical protein [Microsporum canis CBS 113480]EEQ29087.1 conserved hypothetical protein [Microsporum canis CBS 113480]
MTSPAIPSTDAASTSSTANPTDIYQRLSSYSFTADPEFKLGLAVILGQPRTPATDEQINRTDDLVVKAKCFYFSKKFAIQPPIDYILYKQWLQEQPLPSQPDEIIPPSLNNDNETVVSESISASATQNPVKSQEEQPAYPSSFARIVELITTGQPIPGIQQIPDTVLTGQETASTAQRRRKPWEKDEGDQKSDEKENVKSDGIGENGDGSGPVIIGSVNT